MFARYFSLISCVYFTIELTSFTDSGAYLEKHRNEIPCYALRSMLGLRNASQAVESANFFLVADRQKVGGMSWSFSGSEALSLIRTLFENNESQEWFHDHTLAMFQDSE